MQTFTAFISMIAQVLMHKRNTGGRGGGRIFTNMDLDQIKIRSKLRKKVSIEPVNQISISMTSLEKIECLMCFCLYYFSATVA